MKLRAALFEALMIAGVALMAFVGVTLIAWANP